MVPMRDGITQYLRICAGQRPAFPSDFAAHAYGITSADGKVTDCARSWLPAVDAPIMRGSFYGATRHRRAWVCRGLPGYARALRSEGEDRW
jgi:hypothetical protein